MTSVFPVRRRAEEFNTLVEGTSTGGVRDSGLTDFLDLVSAVRDLPRVEPRPAFTASLREQLMAAADTLLLPSEDTQRLTLPPRRTARDRRIAALVGGFAVVGATTSLAVAAQTALPGEMLYPLKRALENAETGIQVSDEAKGASMLASATDRLAEIAALGRAGDLGETTAATTLTSFSDQAMLASDLLLADYAETGDAATIGQLRAFTSGSMETLTQLEGVLPAEARDELVYAAQVLGQIDAAAGRACPGCAGGIDQIPSFLLSSAGQVPEPALVVVPGPVMADKRGGSPAGGPKSGGPSGQKHGGLSGGDDAPLDDPALNPDTPGAGGGAPSGGGNATNPLDALTEPLTGGGGGSTSGAGGSGGGITGVPPVDDVIEDVDEGLPETP